MPIFQDIGQALGSVKSWLRRHVFWTIGYILAILGILASAYSERVRKFIEAFVSAIRLILIYSSPLMVVFVILLILVFRIKERNLKDVNTRLSETVNKLRDTENKLVDTETRLLDTQNELDNVKNELDNIKKVVVQNPIYLWVPVPAGNFLYCQPNTDKDESEYLNAYCISVYPVTNEQYKMFLDATGHPEPKMWNYSEENRKYPVSQVSLNDAEAYYEWITKLTGINHRLPTDKEWQRAARGTDGRIYPWGNNFEIGKCNSLEARKGDVTPVDAYPEGVSPVGCLEMVGNVPEWVGSYMEYVSGEEALIIRGGSYNNPKDDCTCIAAFLLPKTMEDSFTEAGFRVVKEFIQT